jgi:hypothetical protein
MSIDDRAIGHILAAVGEGFVPAGIDRSALRDAIEKACATQRQIDKNRPGPRARACSKQLARIHEAADALLSLLTADNDAAERVTKIVPEAALNVLRLGIAVDSSKRTLDESTKDTAANYRRRVPTAAEWLAGVELPCIYEEYFDRKAALSRNSNTRKPAGPNVRFVKAVLHEINVRFADESIVRAMTRWANLRKRRRVVRASATLGKS